MYEGTIISHCRDLDTDELWEISWPALGNNNAMQTTYNADDMILNCIDGDPSAAITDSNLQQQIDKHIDTLQSLDDFQLYITKHNDTMAKVFGATVPPCDRHLYLAWIWKLFGYGQHASDHPDSLRFPDPYPSGPDGKLHLIKFKKGTRFPIPSGDAWLQMKQQSQQSQLENNPDRVTAATVSQLLTAEYEKNRLASKPESTSVYRFGGWSPPLVSLSGSHAQRDAALMALTAPTPVHDAIFKILATECIGLSDHANQSQFDDAISRCIDKFRATTVAANVPDATAVVLETLKRTITA